MNEDTHVIFEVFEKLVAEPGRVAAFEDPSALLLAVSDGMGGAAAGEVASALVVQSLMNDLASSLRTYAPHAALDDAIARANDAVRAVAKDHKRRGMGATLTAALVRPPIVYVAEVGDSRAYVLRRGELVQLTRDQSHAQYLLDRGLDPVSFGIKRNAILQAIGTRTELTVITSRLELRADDLVLLCSDGLSSLVPDEAIVDILQSTPSLRLRAERLIGAALDAGGDDNVTVVLATFQGAAFPPPSPNEPVRATFQSSYPERREVPLPDDDEGDEEDEA